MIRRAGILTALLVVVAVLFATGFSLLVVEVGVRIVRPDAKRTFVIERLQQAKAGWARPDSTFHHVGDGIYHLDFPTSADTTKPRIMLVGDSFVMGHIVGAEKRFGTLLQRDLGTKATVNVLATSSYSPIIYRKIVRTGLSRAHYNVVAVFVDQTDPGDELVYNDDLLDGGSETFDLPKMLRRDKEESDAYDSLLKSIGRWDSPRRLATLNLFKPLTILDALPRNNADYRHVHLARAEFDGLLSGFNAHSDAPEVRRMEALLLQHLDQIVAMCQAAHVPLVLTANPWEVQSAQHPRVRRRIHGPFPSENRLEDLIAERYGARPGVFVMRMTAAFRADTDPSSLFLSQPPNEIHWNDRGHELVARLLRNFLMHRVHLHLG